MNEPTNKLEQPDSNLDPIMVRGGRTQWIAYGVSWMCAALLQRAGHEEAPVGSAS